MTAPLLQVSGAGEHFAGFVALDGIDLTTDERVDVIIASSGLVGLVQDRLKDRLKARGG
jgi:hypothetical protein